MNGRKTYYPALCLGMMLFVVLACAGPQLKVEPIPMAENPSEMVNLLDSEVSAAKQNHLDVLSPVWFSKAEASLAEAKNQLAQGREISGILNAVALGKAQLKQAREMGDLAKTTLPGVIKARELAREAGAMNLAEDYGKLEESFLELTRAIEDNNVSRAMRDRDRLEEAFLDLELRAIKSQVIDEVAALIAQAEKEGAKKYAPATLALARERLTKTDAFISEHRYEKEKIRSMSADALFQARRLLQITRESQKIRAMEPEQVAVRIDGLFLEVTRALGAPDMRTESFDTQTENLVGSINGLKEDRAFVMNQLKEKQAEVETLNRRYEAETESLKGQIAVFEGKSREEQAERERTAAEKKAVEDRLAAERRFNQLYNDVQGFFAPGEAEVYKQGNQLIIRLRAIQFPVGKAVIMPGNYPLLSKVQKSIRVFGEPDVTIEGHTDSTGSALLNEHLSQQRAESVRQYLVANGTLPEGKIVAAGYGPSRPLAPNETEEGRAINRRIDVVVTPQLLPAK